MWEHYSAPTRPFRTFQNKAVVSSNCAQRPAPPSCCLHLCQPPTSLTASSKVQLDLWPRLKELLRLLLFCPHPVSTLGRLDHMWVKVGWWDWRCLWSGGCCPCCCAVFTAWPHSFASTPTATTVSLAELGESVWYLKNSVLLRYQSRASTAGTKMIPVIFKCMERLGYFGWTKSDITLRLCSAFALPSVLAEYISHRLLLSALLSHVTPGQQSTGKVEEEPSVQWTQ